jgi:catechol 2,3-dioxygenase-like lactoylglutathione lyase family enzyme
MRFYRTAGLFPASCGGLRKVAAGFHKIPRSLLAIMTFNPLESAMYDHIGLKVQDIDASARFFGAVLGALGHVAGPQDASAASFGPEGEAALWIYPLEEGPQGPGIHLAFRAPTRAAVNQFHAAGLRAGGRDNGAPGPRPDYSPTYYAAFLVDPDGNNVEAVCLK